VSGASDSITSSPASTSSSLTSSELELIEQLKRELAAPLFTAVSSKLESYQNRLQYAELKIRVLEERLRLLRIAKYGAGSEKLSDAQLELLELEPGVSNLEVEAESKRETISAVPKTPARKHPGRQELPSDLPRVEQILDCTPEQHVCAGCGKETVVIGYEESQQLDVEPAKYFVRVTKREKRACRGCEERGVMAAPLPPRIIEKGLASDQIVIDTVVRKYCDHTPLYRQSAILERDTGLELSRATLDGWVLKVGELLIPLAGAMRQELLSGSYIQADETPVQVLEEGRGRNHQAYLWQYGRPGGSVVFDFRAGRGRDGPKRFLGGFEGLLQTDGYAAYDRVGGARMVHAACWSHVERYFAEILQLNPQDAVATPIVTRIDELFAIDAYARRQGLSLESRHALRQEKAKPHLDSIRQQIEAARCSALPASALGKACHYTLALWEKLTRFLEYPELELSNNLAENSMRPVAIGRKNWIHVGSLQAGPKIAAILSIVESCRRLKIPVRSYLTAILPGLADLPIQHLSKLTPLAWSAHQS
jgi:transposase